MHCNLCRLDLERLLEKTITKIQQTNNKNFGCKYRCIISKKLPDMSEVMELDKGTFADTLNIFRQGEIEIRVVPYT